MQLIQSLKKLLAGDLTAHDRLPDPVGVALRRRESLPARADNGSPAVFDRELKTLIDDLEGRDRPLVAGSMELLGLDDVRATLGPQWNDHADHALQIAASEIRRYLSEQDFFKPQGETRFLICFASLNREQAIKKAKLIAQSIRARLLEELPEIEEQTSVERFVTEVDPKDLKSGTRGLADRLAATLERIQGEVEIAIATQRRTTLKDFQLVFTPVWQVSTQITAFNLCQVNTISVSRALVKMRSLGDEDLVRQMCGEIDCMILARGIERLHSTARSEAAASLLVPVTFNTLVEPKIERNYFKLLRSVPQIYRKRIVLEILDIGPGVTIGHILWARDRLSDIVDRILVEISDNSVLLTMFEPGDIYGVSCNLGRDGKSESLSLSQLRDLVTMAHESHLATYAHNANTLGSASAAIGAGFQYIDGPAVHLNVSEPRPATRLKPMIDFDGVSLSKVGRNSPRGSSG